MLDRLPPRRYATRMSITAVVENDTIKLPAGVHLPDGTRVVIAAPEDRPIALAVDDALRLLAEHPVDDSVTDAARRHDAYLE